MWGHVSSAYVKVAKSLRFKIILLINPKHLTKNVPGAIYPMVPFRPLVLVDVRDVSLTFLLRNLANPKSRTWATMPSSCRMLLGLISQCTIGTAPQ